MEEHRRGEAGRERSCRDAGHRRGTPVRTAGPEVGVTHRTLTSCFSRGPGAEHSTPQGCDLQALQTHGCLTSAYHNTAARGGLNLKPRGAQLTLTRVAPFTLAL
ncbi:hypothetical protein EYF80_044980 [Liparis tanakae]|uniref:Uncharacterized protein n=1 Tax=Liparis tanakae TaxID=230148 RepID=A0A4Z2FUY9_9TELE|nr:hypothetical protein EYF80_044980 [Liparis tanakae]